VRGVARSIAPSAPMPAMTSEFVMFSPRAINCSLRVSGHDANASSVVAPFSVSLLRSS
jgi:hypothetical protein